MKKQFVAATALALFAVASSAAAQPIAEQAPHEQTASTPFLKLEERIKTASYPVLYYIVKSSFPSFELNEREFTYLKINDAISLALDGMYLRNLKMMAVTGHPGDLASIIEKFSGKNQREICLEYEREYFKEFGSYPTKFISIDIDSIERRLMARDVIR